MWRARAQRRPLRTHAARPGSRRESQTADRAWHTRACGQSPERGRARCPWRATRPRPNVFLMRFAGAAHVFPDARHTQNTTHSNARTHTYACARAHTAVQLGGPRVTLRRCRKAHCPPCRQARCAAPICARGSAFVNPSMHVSRGERACVVVRETAHACGFMHPRARARARAHALSPTPSLSKAAFGLSPCRFVSMTNSMCCA